jgi:hypothetical protein
MPAIASWRATTSSRRSIADPAAEPGSDAATYPAFERTAAELEARIRFLIPRTDAHTTNKEVSRT